MAYNPFTLSGKKILVTGASSGIGRAIAIECSKMGSLMIITGRDHVRLNETLGSLEGAGHKMILADFKDEHCIDIILNDLSELDGVVHSAGITRVLPFKFMREVDLNEVMRVNFIIPSLLSSALIKARRIKPGASILFISSISGILCTSTGGSIYSASKGALNGIVKGMALELASSRIRVNSICPGVIETNIFVESSLTSEQLSEDINKYPLKRHGRPEEVAYAAIYLLSDASEWITGTNLVIDGGYTLL